jgi:hypothetical protein
VAMCTRPRGAWACPGALCSGGPSGTGQTGRTLQA